MTNRRSTPRKLLDVSNGFAHVLFLPPADFSKIIMADRKNTNRKTKSPVARKRRQSQKRSNALNFEMLESRQLLAAVTVSNNTDILSPTADTSSIAALVANDGGDGISLREAVTAANNTTGEDTITFDASVFAGGDNNLIRLTQGELVISDSLTIDGSLADGVVISGDANGDDITLPGTAITDVETSGQLMWDNNRVLNFSSSGDLVLTGLTITGGLGGDGGAIYTRFGNLSLTRSTVSGNLSGGHDGGAIRTLSGDLFLTNSTVSMNRSTGRNIHVYGGGIVTWSGNVSLTNSTVSENSSSRVGGGIRTSSGDVTLVNSTVNGNSSNGAGAGIYTRNGDIHLTNSTVSENNAAESRFGPYGSVGGGIRTFYGDVILTNSTVSGNSSLVNGGGIASGSGVVSLINSTISGNRSGDGGGISNFSGSVSLTNSTVTGNLASGKGGGISLDEFNGRLLVLLNSIVAGNGDNGTAPDLLTESDVMNDLTVEHSLIGDTTGSGITAATGTGNILNQFPLLGPLADHGGPTQTHALLSGSPSVNAGSNAIANTAGFSTDQRGENRIEFGTVDIGALESDFKERTLVVTTNQDIEDQTDGVTSLREAIAFSNVSVTTDTITFDPSVFNVPTTMYISSQLPTITDVLTITGPGANLLTIDAQGGGDNVLDGIGFRIFEVNDGESISSVDVSISGLALTGGDNNDFGGAISNFENLAIDRAAIAGNRASSGGGVSNRLSGVLTITNSTIANNEATQDGGGISTSSVLTAMNVTISGNSALGNGGAIFARGDSSGTTLNLTHSTLTNNTGSGGVHFNNGVGPNTAFFNNTIIDSSTEGVGNGTTLAGGNNLFASDDPGIAGTGNLFNQMSMLGPLADNGGSTLTHALLPGSPAIDSGSNALSLNENGNLLNTEQRGEGRIQFGTVDIGAVEFDIGASEFEEVRSLVVTLNQDVEDSTDGFTSLREAIAFANDPTAGDNNDGDADGDGLLADTITFDARVFTGGNNSVIRLTQGELVISESLSIDASSVGDVVVSGDADGDDVRVAYTAITDVAANRAVLDDNSRVLNFSSPGNLSLTALTITGGRISDLFEGGGGIRTDSGNVSLTDTTVSGNSTADYGSNGGGIFTDSGDLSLTNSEVSRNSVEYRADGGGIFTDSGNVNLTNSTVSGNNSYYSGGGIGSLNGDIFLTKSTVSDNSYGGINSFRGDVSLTNSTVSGNATTGISTVLGNVSLTHSTVSGNGSTADRVGGGGIRTRVGDVSLTNSTVSENFSSGDGGGILSHNSSVSLVNSTVTGNSASRVGGGLSFNTDDVDAERLTLHNSVVAGNTDNGTAPDLLPVSDVMNDLIIENSLIGDTTGSGITTTTGTGNILNQAALLGPLADNGGPTLTHALLPGSPAIDAGSNALALDENGNPLTTDQRDEHRIQSGTVDIGAVESEGAFLLGDANLDGAVNFLDISPFISLLSAGDYLNEADINRDGHVDFLDISPFINVLSSGGSDPVLLGDVNQDGDVDFLDISPFINVLSGDTFLEEADINRDGTVDFLDISPFISLLSSEGSDRNNQIPSNLIALVSSAVTPEAVFVEAPVSSAVSLVAPVENTESDSIDTVVSTAEVVVTTKTVLTKNEDADPVTFGPNTAAKETSPHSLIDSASNSTVVDAIMPQVSDTTEPEVTPDGAIAFAPVKDRLLRNRDSDSRSSVDRGRRSNRPLAERRQLSGNAERLDFVFELRDRHSSAELATEETFLTAAELLDAHPEALDDVFDFPLDETFAGLIE